MTSLEWYIEIIEVAYNPANQIQFDRTAEEATKGDFEAAIQKSRNLLEIEKRKRELVDSIMKEWANTQKWPLDMSQEIADLVMMRMGFALAFLRELKPLRVTFSARGEEVLAWLLVDQWRSNGRILWHHQVGYSAED